MTVASSACPFLVRPGRDTRLVAVPALTLVKAVSDGSGPPGTLLTYTVTYLSNGSTPAYNVAIVDEVPSNTVYEPGSANGAGATIEFSHDGGGDFDGFGGRPGHAPSLELRRSAGPRRHGPGFLPGHDPMNETTNAGLGNHNRGGRTAANRRNPMRRNEPFRPWKPGLMLGLALLLFPALGPPGAGAQDPTPAVSVDIDVAREVTEADPSGRLVTRREPVEVAGPGDVLVYTLRAENVGDSPAYRPRLRDEIPAGTVLVPDSVRAEGVSITASLDGGSTWQEFPVLVERLREDGSSERVPAPPETYTHLQWSLAGQLAPGERREVSFKVRIQ